MQMYDADSVLSSQAADDVELRSSTTSTTIFTHGTTTSPTIGDDDEDADELESVYSVFADVSMSSAAGGVLRLSTVFGMDDTMSDTESVMDPHRLSCESHRQECGWALHSPPPLRDRTSCHVPLHSLAYTMFLC